MEVEVAVLGSPSLISLTVSVDVKHHVSISGFEFRSCVKVEVAVLGSPSLISLPAGWMFTQPTSWLGVQNRMATYPYSISIFPL